MRSYSKRSPSVTDKGKSKARSKAVAVARVEGADKAEDTIDVENYNRNVAKIQKKVAV